MQNAIQPRRTRSRFTVHLEYFGSRGILLFHGSFSADFYCDDFGKPFMSHVADKVREMNRAEAQGNMPGLPSEYDSWDGPIRVECEGAARLLMPE